MLNRLKNLLRPFSPDWLIDRYHFMSGVLAAFYYRLPARAMTVIGVTGTNGKTTTANLIERILAAAGHPVALASTINFKLAGQESINETKMTTISPFALQRFLAKAKRLGCRFVVLEVTSHALVQHRLWGIPFHTTVITNLAPEHIEYHGGFRSYKQAKLKLFANNPALAVINSDEPNLSDFVKVSAGRQIWFGIDQPASRKVEVVGRKLLLEPTGTMFTVVTPQGQTVVRSKLPGRFNVSNMLAAVSVGLGHGIGLPTIKQGLESVELISGRMERVKTDQPFEIIIDYAHHPAAFEQIYNSLKTSPTAKIIHVFGATGGGRDKTKRPIMGALAAAQVDYLILTNDDPYAEDPEEIIEDIARGVVRGRRARTGETGETRGLGIWWWKIPDRRQAIKKALELAQPKDLILITGKGHETIQMVSDGLGGSKPIPWNDRKVVEELLKNKVSALKPTN